MFQLVMLVMFIICPHEYLMCTVFRCLKRCVMEAIKMTLPGIVGDG